MNIKTYFFPNVSKSKYRHEVTDVILIDRRETETPQLCLICLSLTTFLSIIVMAERGKYRETAVSRINDDTY